ncbi:MAG: four helix bundle protein [Flavisolibacter sp.]
MATIKRFEDIDAWQKARALCNRINKIVLQTSLSTDYRLKDQINGSSGSIMDNIAEGFGRGGNAEFIQFLEIAHGSACECQSQLYRIADRNYIEQTLFEELYKLAEEIKGKILAFIIYLKSCGIKGPRFKDRSV